jgi:signal transduction histidine kinase
MKVRHRITLWVSLAGLLSSLILSLIVFFWGLDSPYEFLDQELEIRAHTLIDELVWETTDGRSLDNTAMERFTHLYWSKIYDKGGQLLFASHLAREIELPRKSGAKGYLVATDIPLKRFYSDEEDEPTAFWNRFFTVKAGEKTYQVHLARPVESLVGESIESAIMIGSALFASTLILIVVSYRVAGRILKPVREINQLAAVINEQTLEQRIPLTGNRDEIDELATTLNEMFDRLHYSFLRQKTFLANASHELKTPLTLLRLSTEEILQDQHLPAPVQEKLLGQERALSRISQLVKSLLDLSRLELAEVLERQHFCLGELMASLIEEFQGLLQEQSIIFSGDLSAALPINGDREKLRRLLINLIDNAIRYNRSGGEIRYQATCNTDEIILRLANTGPGIPDVDRERVFEQFYRCEQSRATSHGGSGLGLTIVKRIAELHGGTVTVSSEPPQWTVFTLRLPTEG